MHSLLASPFLGQHLILRPGHPQGIQIHRSSYDELRTAPEGHAPPAWLRLAASQAWGMHLPRGAALSTVVLVREPSPYGFVKASWEINLGCDYDCGFCYLGEKRFAGLSWENKRRLLELLRDAGVLWLQITGGEALIDPQFPAAYEYSHELGLMVQVSTNGSQLHKVAIRDLFTRHRPYRLTVSLYGATEETYEGVTRNRGAWRRFTRGLDAAREADLPVRLNLIVSDSNAHELDGMVRLAEGRWGFPYQVYSGMSPTIDGDAGPLAAQATDHLRPRSVFKGCNAGHTFFHVDPHGNASICKVGRDPSVNLMTEGLDGLPRLGAIAESLQLRTGGCSGCTQAATCRTCRPLAKLYQEAGDNRSLYCQHGGYGS
ncbi:radical SAM protein [Streptomyces cylindrosporus]|uniref:Radical SAM protein n=1 Tax=Streptomyces cylindrosporus TaxID=2927583 RepID=A0ABS9XYS1_9ACTN|nr:radical SAM protein [Streptomyces cylindrosporus]MCI3270118.1 radical SAM protein [Streptomyces cylindrosporus]